MSVILPSYNHDKYICEAIDSVLNQSFIDFELLISDDASVDDSVEKIKSYSDSRIQSYFSSENQGAALNTLYLIGKAKGKYIALINSDDVWFQDKLFKQVSFLEMHEDYVACFSGTDYIDEENNILSKNEEIFKQPNRTQGKWLERLFTAGNCICHPSMLMKTDVYRNVGYYNHGMRQLPDFDMWIRVLKKYKIYILQEALVSHRRFINSGENTSSVTISGFLRTMNESHYIITTFFDDLDDEIFIDGFKKYFHKKEILTKEELICEKFFLLLNDTYYIKGISRLAAVNYFLGNCNRKEVVDTFKKTYNFTLEDFYKVTRQIDLTKFYPPSEDIANIESFIIDRYIRNNRGKVIGVALFNKNSQMYDFVKRIYLKICANKR